MRTLVMFLALICSGALFANNTTFYRNEDTGLVMQLDEGLKQSWTVSNPNLDFELITFEKGDLEEDDLTMLIVGSLPKVEELSTELLPFILEQFNFPEETGIDFKAEKRTSLLRHLGLKTNRVSMSMDVEEAEMLFDLHTIEKDGRLHFILTATISTDFDGEIDFFTEAVLETVRFTH